MERENIRREVEEQASVICSNANAPASNLPENVIDWITNVFIEDYCDEEEEERIPDYYDVLKGMCDYLQEECN